MKPCRDCGQPASPMARSCPHCGILNPVQQWVSFPDGSHLHHREPVGAMGATVAMPQNFLPFSPAHALAESATLGATATLPGTGAPSQQGFGDDRLASWAIWAVIFQLLSTFLIGGLIGGGIAGLLAYPIGSALPVRDDGRKLPVPLSIAMIVGAVAMFALRIGAFSADTP